MGLTSHRRSSGNEDLLDELLRRMPQQPAAAYWRTIELRHLLEEIRRMGGLPGIGLDVGCGDGTVMSILSRRLEGIRVVGLDNDPTEAALAVQTHSYERVHVAGAACVPEPTATFDWVIANSVLEHIPEIDHTLAEMARVLKPGGRLWITVPGPEFHMALAGPGILAPLLGRGQEYFQRFDRRLQHLRYWSREEWRVHLIGHGLQVIHDSEYMPSADARRWEFVSSLTAGLASAIFGGSQTNLAIQRALGVSTGSIWRTFLIAPAQALLLASRVKARRRSPEAHAGLMLVARRTAT